MISFEFIFRYSILCWYGEMELSTNNFTFWIQELK
jgi:hypothetical protein